MEYWIAEFEWADGSRRHGPQRSTKAAAMLDLKEMEPLDNESRSAVVGRQIRRFQGGTEVPRVILKGGA